MDKNYFVAPRGNAPKHIRSQLSGLTNLVLLHLNGGNDEGKIEECLNTLFDEPWYLQFESNQLSSQLHRDLQAACHYWEVNWRYDECWPFLEKKMANLY